MPPLIIAIEPDRRQVSKLAMLARNYLHTEIVVTDSIGRAMAMLDERLPDLILTSFQLQPKHRAALMDRLLEVDADGTRVQTLTIPILGAPGYRPSYQSRGLQLTQQKGMPARPHGMPGNHGVADGCDPAVFGQQIAECLGRIPAERKSAPAVVRRAALSPTIPEPQSPDAETRAESEVPTPMPVAASDASPRLEGLAAAPEPAPPARLARPEWRDLLSTIRRDLARMRADHAEPSGKTTPAESLMPAPKVESPQRIRRRTGPSPEQEEWDFIKRGFASLANVNEIAEEGKTPAKKSA